jgi:hypothetical protein
MSQEKIKHANGVIRSRKLKKDRQHNGQKKKAKRTNIDKQTTTLKLKIEEHESHQKSRMNSGAAEGKAMPAPPMTPVVLLFICYADGQNSIQKY